jgi:hypothetical protein
MCQKSVLFYPAIMYGQICRDTQARSRNFSSLERQKRKFYINQFYSTSHQYNLTQRDPNVWPQTTNLNGWSHLYSGKRSLHSDCDTRWATQKSRFEPNRSRDFFLQGVHNIIGVQPASYLRVPPVKRPRREVDHSAPYSELQNKWSYTSWRVQNFIRLVHEYESTLTLHLLKIPMINRTQIVETKCGMWKGRGLPHRGTCS